MLCESGEACEEDTDCLKGTCDKKKNVCTSCIDGIRNGAETDIDCGTSKCPKCKTGLKCKHNFQCMSNKCVENRCVSCTNNLRDGNETDVDCGAAENGGCKRPCSVGMSCLVADDCVSGICKNSRCVAGSVTKLCSNKVRDLAPPGQTRSIQNKDSKKVEFKRKFDLKSQRYNVHPADETCVDGGGELCAEIGLRCGHHKACRSDDDCDVSLFCAHDEMGPSKHKDYGTCERCNKETCGYKHQCGLCSQGTRCRNDKDCHSGSCYVSEDSASSTRHKMRRGQLETNIVIWGSCVSCFNGIQDGFETDIDCGGTTCSRKCDVERYCKKHSDCRTKHCSEFSGRCISETRLERCTNGHLDLGEICIDGSGICRDLGKLCEEGEFCMENSDCSSSLFCDENTSKCT